MYVKKSCTYFIVFSAAPSSRLLFSPPPKTVKLLSATLCDSVQPGCPPHLDFHFSTRFFGAPLSTFSFRPWLRCWFPWTSVTSVLILLPRAIPHRALSTTLRFSPTRKCPAFKLTVGGRNAKAIHCPPGFLPTLCSLFASKPPLH